MQEAACQGQSQSCSGNPCKSYCLFFLHEVTGNPTKTTSADVGPNGATVGFSPGCSGGSSGPYDFLPPLLEEHTWLCLLKTKVLIASVHFNPQSVDKAATAA